MRFLIRKSYFVLAVVAATLLLPLTGNAQTQKIVASARHSQSYFGESVATYGDKMVVGAHFESFDEEEQDSTRWAGAAYFYKKDAQGKWNQEQKIVATPREAIANFGHTVAIYDDIALVSAYTSSTDINGGNEIPQAGKVFIYQLNAQGVWVYKQSIVASDRQASGNFGWSLAIHKNRIVVGTTTSDVEGVETGKAYVFELDAQGTWVETDILFALDGVHNDDFGADVDVFGRTIAVTAWGKDVGSLDRAGAVYLFEKDADDNWIQSKKLLAPIRQEGARFGKTVSLDGESMMITADAEDDNSNGIKEDAGAIYFYEKDDLGEWDFEQKIVPDVIQNQGRFGFSVDLVGCTMITGAFWDHYNEVGQDSVHRSGAAYIFTRDEFGVWQQSQKITSEVRSVNQYMGFDVSLSQHSFVVTAKTDDLDENNQNEILNSGAAYIGSIENCKSTRSSISVVHCGMYTVPSGEASYSESGIVIDTILNEYRCDSIITIDLTIECPKVIDYFIPGDKVIALDRAASDQFGISVELDGNWMYVGNWLDDLNETGISQESAGAVYVYKKLAGNKWKQVQKIVSHDRGIKDQFGRSLAVSGNYMIVGARYENHNLSGTDSLDRAGSVYLFERNVQGVWEEVQKIIPADRDVKDEFGFSVAIDSAYAIVGASQKNGKQGAAYVIERSANGTWEIVQKLLGSSMYYNIHYGSAVQLQGDVAVVSASSDFYDENGENSLSSAGAAYIYERIGNANWVLQQKIVAADREKYNYYGIDLSLDGNYLAVSSIGHDKDEYGFDSIPDAGAVYMYKYDGNSWNQEQKLVSIDRSKEANFGSSLDIHGNRLIIGESHGDFDENGIDSLVSAGSAYYYELDGGEWEFRQKLLAYDREDRDWFGTSAAISDSTIAIGAMYEDEDTLGLNTMYSAGSVYTFQISTSCSWLDTSIEQFEEYLLANELEGEYQWLDCADNYAPLFDETYDWIEGLENNSYAVQISKNGCVDTSECILISITGLVDQSSGSVLEYYPNPVEDYIQVKGVDVQAIDLISLAGTLIMSVETSEMNVEEIQNGMYLLRVTTKKGDQIIERIIKN